MRKTKIFLSLLCLLFSLNSKAQNEKFKALFIYNFTNYIEWPDVGGTSFVIAVVGDSPIINELQAISKIKKIGNATIEVQKVNSVEEIAKPNIVFIPAQKKKQLAEICRTLAGKPVLIISDNAQGDFGINFIDSNQKQSFQICKSRIEERRLKVNSSLLALGIAVN